MNGIKKPTMISLTNTGVSVVSINEVTLLEMKNATQSAPRMTAPMVITIALPTVLLLLIRSASSTTRRLR